MKKIVLVMILAVMAIILVCLSYPTLKKQDIKTVETVAVEATPIGPEQPLGEWYDPAEDQRSVIRVENTPELIEALGSDRIIQLASGTYNLSSVLETSNPHVILAENQGALEFIINRVQNLTIQSLDDNRVHIIRKNNGAVITFQDSKGVILRGLEAYHEVDTEYCTGAVFDFIDCENIKVENSVLHGCGAYGLEFTKVMNIQVTGTTIKNCSNFGVAAVKCHTVRFKDCRITDNQSVGVFYFANSRFIELDHCDISNNHTGFDGIFYLWKSPVTIQSSRIANNQSQYLLVTDAYLNLDRKDVVEENNQYSEKRVRFMKNQNEF